MVNYKFQNYRLHKHLTATKTGKEYDGKMATEYLIIALMKPRCVFSSSSSSSTFNYIIHNVFYSWPHVYNLNIDKQTQL